MISRQNNECLDCICHLKGCVYKKTPAYVEKIDELPHDKTSKMTVHPAKTQIRPV